MIQKEIFEYIKMVKANAQTGLTYSEDPYDIARYKDLSMISDRLVNLITDQPISKISGFYIDAKEYPTPKTDIRAVVFNEKEELLLVKEKADGHWAIPGGWADIGVSPAEVAIKEVQEETGLVVEPFKLLAVLDKKRHPHPPCLEHTYKFFIQCKIVGGKINKDFDILDVQFFDRKNIPPLSLERIVQGQIDLVFEFLDDPQKETVFD